MLNAYCEPSDMIKAEIKEFTRRYVFDEDENEDSFYEHMEKIILHLAKEITEKPNPSRADLISVLPVFTYHHKKYLNDMISERTEKRKAEYARNISE